MTAALKDAVSSDDLVLHHDDDAGPADTLMSEKDAEAFRSIGEAAGELGLKPHVLRFWETKFDNLTPLKRKDGRRYYRPEDMEILRKLQDLLHVQGLTIRGAMKLLEDGHVSTDDGAVQVVPEGTSVQGLQDAVRTSVERGDFASEAIVEAGLARERLEALLGNLVELKDELDRARLAA